MSLITRITTACFTACPGFLFFGLVMLSGMDREYYWISILTGVSVLVGSALQFGFFVPPAFRPKWFWIMAAGFAAMLMALFAIAVVNTTPLCVGQNNGDGNSSFGMCMGYVILYAFFYGIPYLFLLAVSAFVGHWVMKFQNCFGGRL